MFDTRPWAKETFLDNIVMNFKMCIQRLDAVFSMGPKFYNAFGQCVRLKFPNFFLGNY